MNSGIFINPTFAVVAVSYGILLSLAFAAGLFGVLLLILITLSLWRYCYAVLRTAAQGRPQFEPPAIESTNPVGEISVTLHFVFFVSLAVLFSYMDEYGDGPLFAMLTWAGPLALGAVFPASAALMGITSNLGASLNPFRIVELIGVLGRRYLSLLLLCVAIVALFLAARSILSDAGSFVVRSLGNILYVWVSLTVFASIGQAIYERRDLIDVPAAKETSAEREYREVREEWRKSVDLAYASIRSGLTAEGYRELKRLITAENESIEVLDWLFEALLQWEDKSHALAVGRKLIERLLDAGDPYRAAKMYIACRQRASDFELAPATAAAIAEYSRSIGWNEVADKIGGG